VKKVGLTYVLPWWFFLCKKAGDSISHFLALSILSLVVPSGSGCFYIRAGLIRRDLSDKR
jgi:hypothetical protein